MTEEAWKVFRDSLAPSSESVEGEQTSRGAGDELYRTTAMELVKRFRPHDGPWGTINVIALDESGELVVGVSTSGYPVEVPGSRR